MKHRLVSPVLMWLIVALGTAAAVRLLPAHAFFSRNHASYVVFGLVAINWLYFFLGGGYANRRAPLSAAAIERVVTTGVYAKVRHPIYSADILLAWAIFLLIPTLRALTSVVWLTAVLLFWMKLEESALLERFGDDYAEYKARTPMVIPRYFG